MFFTRYVLQVATCSEWVQYMSGRGRGLGHLSLALLLHGDVREETGQGEKAGRKEEGKGRGSEVRRGGWVGGRQRRREGGRDGGKEGRREGGICQVIASD